MRSLGIGQERSHQSSQGSWKKSKKKTHIFFTLPVTVPVRLRQRCQGAMPRLMPSRVLLAHCMIWLVTAGRAGQPPWPPSGLFSVNGGSFWSPRPGATKSIASLLIFHPITHSAGGTTRPKCRTEHAIYLPSLALKTFLGQKRRGLIAY